jgi:replication factor C small subunit
MSDIDPFANLWVAKHAPTSLNGVVLSAEDRELFESFRTKQEIPHLLFAGTPGVGKTLTSKLLISDVLRNPDYIYLNASDENSIDTIRGKIIGFARTKSFDGRIKIVLLDEICGLSGDAMKCLRNVMEEFASNTRFIMTCNYLFKVIPPIQSRCTIVNLVPPVEGVVKRIIEILKKETVTIPEEQKPLLLDHIKRNLPDIRRIINDIQKYSNTGTLQIRNEVSAEFVEGILTDIKEKKDLMAIRKYIIENEKQFSNDYRHLMKEMFEAVFRMECTHDCKTSSLLAISKGLELDAFVVDKEINCFATLLKLSQCL